MITVRSLLADNPALRAITQGTESQAAYDAPISWVHSSDLRDPTPWLEHGQVLLTDGVHFADDHSEAFAMQYAQRLSERGVLALGFATDIVHMQIPSQLVDACERVGLMLFEVRDKTPFIGIIQLVANDIAAESRSRLEWLLQAQRAVARAALHRDGMRAIMAELARQLGSPVVLYDSVGNRVELPGIATISPRMAPIIDDAAREVLAKGGQAGYRIVDVGEGAVLQTLGRGGHLLGVLAVGTGKPLESAESDLVASVIALASIALEQRRALDGARARLRSGLLELLLAGVVEVADRTSQNLWGRLPQAPLRVTVLAEPVSGQALVDEFEAAAEVHGGAIFFAERSERIVIVSGESDTPQVHAILASHGSLAGTSSVIEWADLRVGLAEAHRASMAAGRRSPVVIFDDIAEHGMIGLLTASGGTALAARILEPVLRLPLDERATALQTLHAWFAANCSWDPAARALAVHRHTLRNRIKAIEQLLHTDLEDFGSRAEVWAALQLLDTRTFSGA